MYYFPIIQFHSSLGWNKHIKVWHAICDCSIHSYIFMKQHSIDCIKFWRRFNQQSTLKSLQVNTQKIIIMFWVEESQDMVHFIIINWFNWSDVWICNGFRIRFNRKLWRVNLKITITTGMMIKYNYDIWNHRTDFGRRGPGFEVICWRLTVPPSWWISFFFTMKGVELIDLYY